MCFVENNEASPRAWYGGAVGHVGFDGALNTGLTLRTIHVRDGVGEVRAGATLLYDSDPVAEEAETELKASALLDALTRAPTAAELAAEVRDEWGGPSCGTHVRNCGRGAAAAAPPARRQESPARNASPAAAPASHAPLPSFVSPNGPSPLSLIFGVRVHAGTVRRSLVSGCSRALRRFDAATHWACMVRTG